MTGDGWYVGVDSGGTKTQAVVGLARGGSITQMASVVVPAGSNPLDVGIAAAVEVMVRAVRLACEQAGIAPHQLQGGCAAVAGCGRAETRIAMEAGFEQHFAQLRMHWVHDGWAALASAGVPPVGVAVISGTGSLVFARTSDGRTARTGGWGYLLGDEGSGFAIGRAALVAVARAYDGRAQPTRLAQALAIKLHVTGWEELLRLIYQQAKPRQMIAELAPVVLRLAEEGDRASRAIVQRASEDLAEMIEVVVRQLKVPPVDLPLILSGGMLSNCQFLRHELLERLRQFGVEFAKHQVVPDPALGALRLAVRCEQLPDRPVYEP